MSRLIVAVFFLIVICSCSTLSLTSHQYPKEFIGTWGLESNNEDCCVYLQNYPKGKSVAIGMCYGSIFAYEAEWWVEGDFFYERITNELYSGIPEDSVGEISMDKIKYVDDNKHILEEDRGTVKESVTYLKVNSPINKNKKQ